MNFIGQPKPFNPKRLKEARLARGLTIKELAERTHVSKQAVSQFELGVSSPKSETLMRIVNILGFPRYFFHGQDQEEAVGNIFFRSASTTSKKLKQMQEIRTKWLGKIQSFLSEYVEFPKLNLPDMTLYGNQDWDTSTIEELAHTIRQFWNLGNKPIKNIIHLLEKNGITVASLSFVNNKIDAFSQLREGRAFIILSEDKESAVRRQFDAAHELGHLLMHQWVDDQEQLTRVEFKEMEAQAHRFASALLLPADSFSDTVASTDLEYFKELKKYWKVSIAAMIRRCRDIGLINENQYVYLNKKMSSQKMRRKEPLDDIIKVPSPNVLRQAFELLLENNICSVEEILMSIELPSNEIENLASLRPGTLSPKEKEQVVPLNLKC